MLLDTTSAQASVFPALLSVQTVILAQTVSAALSVLQATKTPPAEPALWDTTNPQHSVLPVRLSLQTVSNAPAQPLAPSAPWDSQAQLAPHVTWDILDHCATHAFRDTTRTVGPANLALLSVPTVFNAPIQPPA